jgi:hypothetical protein
MQPTFFPWIGYFKLIEKCDVFVFLDDVQFDKRSWQQRNKLNFNSEAKLFTVPVLSKQKFNQLIINTEIDNNQNWKQKHLNGIKQNYKKTLFYNKYIGIVESIYAEEFVNISDLNIYIIKKISEILNLNTSFVLSSSLKYKDHKTEKLIKIINKMNCKTYISPMGSKDYIDEERFIKNKIDLQYFGYQPIPYKQLNSNSFIPFLSVLDFLFNCDNKFDLV